MPGMESEEEKAPEGKRPRRLRCAVGITIEWGAAKLRGRVADISAHGIFVELENPLWVGARFAGQLELDSPVKVECVVRRVQPLRGMAATYSVVDEAQCPAVAALLESLSRR
jgi:hypothetical protein